MENKKPPAMTPRAAIAVIPAVLVSVLSLSVILLRLVFEDAAWLEALAWVIAGLAAVSPGTLLLLLPLRKALSRAIGGYMVKEAVALEGVGRESLDRCAAIAEANASHPVAACLRGYCGDVAAPPDKFVEMEGLGASAQFSGQMIHVGSAEYMQGLQIEAPGVPGKTVFVALEGRLLGYYRLLAPAETERMKNVLLRAIAACSALKIIVWVTLALTGADYLPLFVGCETVALAAGLMTAYKL